MLNERNMEMAKSLARDLVRVEREKEFERKRLERERRARSTRESFDRVVRNIQNALEGFLKPLNKAYKSLRKGYHSQG